MASVPMGVNIDINHMVKVQETGNGISTNLM